ncbi:MAG: cytochrome c [Pseudomonadota bacterium]|nr:cytochrome c [Pseudomonadota bacterium]
MKNAFIATALVAALGLAGCSSQEDSALGNVAAGEKQANTKGAATGQSCIDCHGASGNAPIDATYPKLGGQYRDYLVHALQMYRSGERSNALMSQQARDLTDQQINDLAAYFAAQPSQLRDLSAP